jgi:membrane-bound ClpP family serine protease
MEWYITVGVFLVGIGLVMLLTEFFFPTGGVLVVLGFTSCAAAVGLVLLYGDRREAIASVLALCIGMPITLYLLLKTWSRLSLKSGLNSDTLNMTIAQTPEITELEKLRGKIGKTVSPMRPSGTVEIEGRRIDAMSEGTMIDADVWIKCVEVRFGRVIVRVTDTDFSTEPDGIESR